MSCNRNNWWNNFLLTLPNGCNCQYSIYFLLIIPIFIFIYGIIVFLLNRKKPGNVSNNDIMNNKVMDIPAIGQISGWKISHYILFLIMGILFPHCDLIVITLGILWEVVEFIIGEILKHFFGENQYVDPTKEYSKKWITGSWTDIIFNVAGFYTGKLYVTWWKNYMNSKSY